VAVHSGQYKTSFKTVVAFARLKAGVETLSHTHVFSFQKSMFIFKIHFLLCVFDFGVSIWRRRRSSASRCIMVAVAAARRRWFSSVLRFKDAAAMKRRRLWHRGTQQRANLHRRACIWIMNHNRLHRSHLHVLSGAVRDSVK
jgi:hypothetical protein